MTKMKIKYPAIPPQRCYACGSGTLVAKYSWLWDMVKWSCLMCGYKWWERKCADQ